MENLWELIESPPAWVILLVLCFAVSYTMREIVRVISQKTIDVMAVLEISVVMILMILALHSYFARNVETGKDSYQNWILLLFICVFFSGGLYIFYKALFMILRKYFPPE